MKLGKLERVLGFLGAIATLVAFADTYLFNSRLTATLRLPPTVPTGILLVVLFALVGVTMVLSARLSKHSAEAAQLRVELGRAKTECSQISAELQSVRNRAAAAERQLHGLSEKMDHAISLRKQVIAILELHSRNEDGIQTALGINSWDPDAKLLREILADLVNSKDVQRDQYGLNYELRRKSSPEGAA